MIAGSTQAFWELIRIHKKRLTSWFARSQNTQALASEFEIKKKGVSQKQQNSLAVDMLLKWLTWVSLHCWYNRIAQIPLHLEPRGIIPLRMACLNYRPSVVHFKKGQGGPISGAKRGIFYSGGMELSVQLPFRKLVLGFMFPSSLGMANWEFPLFGLKGLVKKAAKKKGRKKFLDSFWLLSIYSIPLYQPQCEFLRSMRGLRYAVWPFCCLLGKL